MTASTAATPAAPERPRWRGRLHQAAFFASIPAGIVAISAATTAPARAAAAVYAVGIAVLYGTSATYHRLARSPRARALWRRLDHAAIYVAIAATATPVAVGALNGAWRVGALGAVWAGALAGVVLRLVGGARHTRAASALYLVLGWAALAALPQLARELGRPAVALLLLGGVLYTAGAAVLATHRPDPVPAVFGYHEVWHAFVVVASACHYAVVLGAVGGVGPA